MPWRNKTQLWAVPYALLYTSFFLGLMWNSNFLPAHVFWRPSRRLWIWAFISYATCPVETGCGPPTPFK
jgi:hypothetical protein